MIQAIGGNVRGESSRAYALLPLRLARHARAQSGRIVNIASAAGCQLFRIVGVCYEQDSVDRFSEQLAIEVQPYGVTVFAIHPGAVRTAMVEEARHKIPLVQTMLDAKEVTPDWQLISSCSLLRGVQTR
jgi:NAD(P)-dependent dehydrogenase (short-subunit alcohol dehydrogenase family)